MFKQLLIFVGALLLTGCSQPSQWTLFYYPGVAAAPSVLEAKAIGGYYQTLEQCQSKGAGMLRLSGQNLGVFVCALECEQTDSTVSCKQLNSSVI
ncbi:MAG: hypothetical protein ACRCT7_13400 [Shewanella sp.]